MRISKISACLAVLLALSACKEEQKTASSAPAQTLLPVDVLEVQPRDVPLSFEFSARAQGYKETEVRARVSGILLKKNYIEGAEVKEGDVLFEIDPKEYKAKLNNAKALRIGDMVGKDNGVAMRLIFIAMLHLVHKMPNMVAHVEDVIP